MTEDERMHDQSAGLKHKELTEQIIGAFYNVYNELGYGFLEQVYEQALTIALIEPGLRAERQFDVPVWFQGQRIGEYRADLLVEHTVVVELKAAKSIDPAHEAQLLHYLRATEFEVGLLLNFGQRPQLRRLLFDNDRKQIRENPCKSVAKGFTCA